ncbi:DUF4124 domain-containing protein [Aquincola sp. MAHUQ-54]|uniref:DUF4124 domain-containing protein n=1 Tax=Aquincola agrisoli TaxID=3119538 RepID=A0AAW9QK93_9BURK
MHSCSLFAIAGLLLALSSPAAHAQWVWKDNRNQVHASDLPPPRDIPDKNILQRPTPGNPPRAAAAAPAPSAVASDARPEPRQRVDPELEARRQRAEQEQAAQRKTEEARQAAQRIENCNRARDALRQLESGMRIARINEKGEREILDDQARAAETQRARDVAASECR